MNFLTNENKSPLVSAAVVLGGALFLSSFVIGSGIRAKNSNNTITSTGSAKMQVVSDSAKLTMNITRRVGEFELKNGYARLANDTGIIKKLLADNGIDEKSATFSAPYAAEVWNQDAGAPRRFDLNQSVTVQSGNIAKVKTLAENATKLVASSDIMLQVNNVEFYYSKLAEARISLLGEAIKDAKARAKEIAKSAGNRVGSLQSASGGVVQVLAPNSVNVDDYGSYDTSTEEKDIMVTVKGTFKVR